MLNPTRHPPDLASQLTLVLTGPGQRSFKTCYPLFGQTRLVALQAGHFLPEFIQALVEPASWAVQDLGEADKVAMQQHPHRHDGDHSHEARHRKHRCHSLDLHRITDPAHRAAILRLHQVAGLPAWWDVYAEDVAEPVVDLTWFESMATGIRTFSATIIDGLVQTTDYARTVIEAADIDHAGQIERWIEMRIMRQTILSRPASPTFAAVIAEEVLARRIGGPVAMAAQLRQLVSLNARPNIDIRVLPVSIGAHASPTGGFRLLDLGEPMAEVVTVECPAGQLYLESPRTARFVALYDRLRDTALDSDATTALMEARAQELERS